MSRKCSKSRGLSLCDAQDVTYVDLTPRLKMDALKAWLTAQFEERKVEPNSGLGEAITYMLKYWEQLTLCLHQPGAPPPPGQQRV